MADPTDITIGEVWRGLQAVQSSLAALSTSLGSLRAALSSEVDVQISDKLQLHADRITRLERVVYGAVGVILTSVLVGVLALLTNNQ
jgi:hypothetical protein